MNNTVRFGNNLTLTFKRFISDHRYTWYFLKKKILLTSVSEQDHDLTDNN